MPGLWPAVEFWQAMFHHRHHYLIHSQNPGEESMSCIFPVCFCTFVLLALSAFSLPFRLTVCPFDFPASFSFYCLSIPLLSLCRPLRAVKRNSFKAAYYPVYICAAFLQLTYYLLRTDYWFIWTVLAFILGCQIIYSVFSLCFPVNSCYFFGITF